MAEASQPITRRRPWGITFFGLLAVAGLISMPFVAGKPGDEELPDIIRFIGHFHPVLLHLPIGVFILIVLQELGAIFFRGARENQGASLFPLFFGAASSIVAVIAGFLLYHGHAADYAGDPTADRHLWGGLIFAVFAVITFIFKAWCVATAGNPAWYRMLLFGSVGIMSFASHDGASLTHGSDYLTKYAPDPIRRMLGLEPAKPAKPADKAPGEQLVYADIVAPILERRCVQCHKPGKIKGKLRMDTFEMLVKGGSEGPAIEPGKSAESNIIVRMELPEDDDEHMPPEGKPDIEDHEIAVIKWWIDSGADPAKPLSAFQVPAEIQAALAKLSSVPAADLKESAAGHGAPAKAAGPDEQLKSAVSGLSKDFPGALSFESQQSANVTFTAVSLRGKLDDETFGKLGPVIPKLVTADLSATKITDKSVASLASASQLRQLRLAETPVTDAAIDALLKIPSLESVNFYGTKVTDAGVAKLAALPNLKRLYVWQTAVTPAAIEELRKKLPKCEIIGGAQ